MKNIEYSISNIQEFKKNFKENNNLILDNIKLLEKEFDSIGNVLSTPKSNEIMPELYLMIKKYDEMITNNGIYFDDVLNTAINEYSSFINELEMTLEGDNNGHN